MPPQASANPPVTHIAAARGVSWNLMSALLRRGSRELSTINRQLLANQRAQSATWRRRAALGLGDDDGDGSGSDEADAAAYLDADAPDLRGEGIITGDMVNLRGQAIDRMRRYTGTVLMHAAQQGHAELVTQLAEVPGALLDAVRPHSRRTALHLAAFNGHIGVVEALVVAGADVTALDSDGDSVLVSAIRGNNPTLVTYVTPVCKRKPVALARASLT